MLSDIDIAPVLDGESTLTDVQGVYERYLMNMNQHLHTKLAPHRELITLLLRRHTSIRESHRANLWTAKRHASYVSSGALCTFLWFMSHYSGMASCIFFITGSVLVAFIESLILNLDVPDHVTDGKISELVANLDL